MKPVAFIAAAFVLGAAPAQAQALTDPTRPPSIDANAAGEAAPAPGRLQSILLSPQRKLAVIDGKPVALGGKVGDAVLVSILPSGVVLREGGAERSLALFPAMQKEKEAPSTGGSRKPSAKGAAP